MPTFLNALDMTGKELRNFVVQLLGTDPATPPEGRMWYDSSAHVLKYRTDVATVTLGPATADVPLSLYDANSILKADTDNTPVALPVAASTLLGRAAAGGIDALAPAVARGVLGLGALATLSTVTTTEIADGTIQNLDIAAAAGIALSKLAVDPLARANHTGTQLANTVSNFDAQVRTNRLDQMAAPTAAVSMNSQLLSNVATPTAPADAANKAYVDNAAAGLDVKASVRVAVSTAVTLASPGATLDGVTMVAGDRVLLMAQAAGAENGLWQWNGAAAAMTRTTDADTSAEVNPGMFTFSEEGSNGDKGWVLTTNAPIALGTTALTFTQFSGGAGMVGTANRITVTGAQIDIASTYVGQASITTVGTIGTGTWQGTPVGVVYGGTGANSAAGAKTNLGFLTRFTQTFGDASTLTYTLTHNLGTLDVVVEVFYATGANTGATVYCDVVHATTNTVTVAVAVAPGAGALRAVVVG
jgi:hypothetical protein